MRHLALALVLLAGCATVPPAPQAASPAPCNFGLTLLNASLWVQLASEYDANAIQTYNAARRAVDAALAAGGDKPLAVILDVDETSVDNTAFEGRMILKGITYDKQDWLQWVSESRAKAIPGAGEFLQYVHARGVTPFFITNRDQPEEAATRKNLENLGYPLRTDEDTLLTRGERPEWKTSLKSGRREWVASRYRVAAVIGDDLNDFVDAHAASQEERDALVARNAAEWGSRWFILPNPMYGSWETPILAGAKECEALKKRLEALDTGDLADVIAAALRAAGAPVDARLVAGRSLGSAARASAASIGPLVESEDLPQGTIRIDRAEVSGNRATVTLWTGPIPKAKPGEILLDCGKGQTFQMEKNKEGKWVVVGIGVSMC